MFCSNLDSFRFQPRRRPTAQPATVSAFRLTGSGRSSSDDPLWLPDDMGGVFDPSDPRLGRRDFLLRAVVAAVALTVGTAVHAASLTLARDFRAARAPASTEAETLSGGRP